MELHSFGKGDRKFWCNCPGGPTPILPRPEPERARAFGTRPNEAANPLESESAPGRIDEWDLTLEHFARITYTFWKPIEIPIDLTVKVSPK